MATLRQCDRCKVVKIPSSITIRSELYFGNDQDMDSINDLCDDCGRFIRTVLLDGGAQWTKNVPKK